MRKRTHIQRRPSCLSEKFKIKMNICLHVIELLIAISMIVDILIAASQVATTEVHCPWLLLAWFLFLWDCQSFPLCDLSLYCHHIVTMPPDSSKGNVRQHRASQRSVECIIQIIQCLQNCSFIHELGVDIDNIGVITTFLPNCWLSHVCRYWGPGTRGAEQIIVCRHSALWTSLQQYWSVNIATSIVNITRQLLWTSRGNNCERHYNNPSTFIVHIEHAHVHIDVQVLCQLNVEGITDQIIVCRHSALWTSLGNNCVHYYNNCEHK